MLCCGLIWNYSCAHMMIFPGTLLRVKHSNSPSVHSLEADEQVNCDIFTWHQSSSNNDDWVIVSHICIEEPHKHKPKAKFQRFWCAIVFISLKLKYAQNGAWGVYTFMVNVYTNTWKWWVIDLRWWPTPRNIGVDTESRRHWRATVSWMKVLHLKPWWCMCEGAAHC